ncbi:hypothetical protein IAR55_005428 [Kwoniella newhampshirensis]|uniref:Inner centromere protein ARK-binding domain-containing protein n=1 Tax=Kwoniella newhampshirensis TaxID=1651941 RepID=A0AAW0YM79_9TREE
MSHNPPILAVPHQKPATDDHLHRFLSSLQPYVVEHAQLGRRALEEALVIETQGTSTQRDVEGPEQASKGRPAVHQVSNLQAGWRQNRLGEQRLQTDTTRARSHAAVIKRSDNPDQADMPREHTDTESAQRRLQRKIRRREKAAIVKPKQFIGDPPDRQPSPSQPSKRQASPDYGGTSDRHVQRWNSKDKRSDQKQPRLTSGLRLREVPRPNDDHTLEDRIKTRPSSKRGFLAYGKASLPIHMPQSKIKLKPARPFSEDEFLKGSHRRLPPIEEHVESMDWNRRPSKWQGERLARTFPVEETRPRRVEDQVVFNRARESNSNHDYARLLPSGHIESPRWPTDTSEPLTATLPMRPSQASSSRIKEPDFPLQPPWHSSGPEELKTIMSAGKWRWPSDHPLRPVVQRSVMFSIRPAQPHSILGPRNAPLGSPRSIPLTNDSRYTPRTMPSLYSQTPSSLRLHLHSQEFELDEPFWTGTPHLKEKTTEEDDRSLSANRKQSSGMVSDHTQIAGAEKQYSNNQRYLDTRMDSDDGIFDDQHYQSADSHLTPELPISCEHAVAPRGTAVRRHYSRTDESPHTLARSLAIYRVSAVGYQHGSWPIINNTWTIPAEPHGQPEMPVSHSNIDGQVRYNEAEQYGATEEDWRRLWQGKSLLQ